MFVRESAWRSSRILMDAGLRGDRVPGGFRIHSPVGFLNGFHGKILVD